MDMLENLLDEVYHSSNAGKLSACEIRFNILKEANPEILEVAKQKMAKYSSVVRQCHISKVKHDFLKKILEENK